ncbi:hypothetical protein AArcSl_1801 [Halalkaliarchaeum desulfuricum]|uniref:Uncharacterized protein n=1 Tax=Halalkaliarchaeum desulfuricum TaxID=2055893 RepID=A0A343TK05_9EURY|nr:hypothetical protein [Halalkaliarchaeum desulfuricum]AUX09427.1 hypothetical protein AArcSl_1801 [Halalkaliarchaeum desulfuricum]
MRRRSLLISLGAATTVGLAGCLGDGPPTDGTPGNGGDSDDNDGAPDGDPVLTAATLSEAACEEPETATVTVDEDALEVHVDGCIVGNTGCHVPVLVEPTFEDEPQRVAGDLLRVRIATVDDSDPDEMCTQVLTDLGYEATFVFEEALPTSVEVVHETHDGDRTVATTDR